MNLRSIQGSIREYWRRSKGFEKSGLKRKYGGKPDENSIGIGKTEPVWSVLEKLFCRGLTAWNGNSKRTKIWQ